MLTCTNLPCLCMPTRHTLTFLSDTSPLQSYGLIHVHISYVYLGISTASYTSTCTQTSSRHPRMIIDSCQLISRLLTKSSSNLWLMPNRLVHSHVYSSHLDLAAHDLQLMPDHLKTLSHLSLVSYLFLSTHDDSSQGAHTCFTLTLDSS